MLTDHQTLNANNYYNSNYPKIVIVTNARAS